MSFRDIVNGKDKISKYISVVDENNNVIRQVKSYNNKTKEAEIYKVDDNGKVIIENGEFVVEKVVLNGTRIVFSDFNFSSLK
jgi:hypothetical protein